MEETATQQKHDRECKRKTTIMSVTPIKGEIRNNSNRVMIWGKTHSYKDLVKAKEMMQDAVYVTKLTREANLPQGNHFHSKLVVATAEKDGQGKVFALDCEIVKTARKEEQCKINIVDHTGQICYASLTKLPVLVIDYSTDTRPLAEEDLDTVTNTLKDLEDNLASFVLSKDVTVGRRLNVDLVVLHQQHRIGVDIITGLEELENVDTVKHHNKNSLDKDFINSNGTIV